MLIRNVDECPEFLAGDETRLRELLHPEKANLKIRYSLAHATLPADTASLRHYLVTSEVYYVLSGAGLMHIDDEMRPVCSGDTIYIPPGCTQYIENTGEGILTFLCIVDPAWKEEDEVVEDTTD